MMGRNYCGQMTRAGTRGGLALARGRVSLAQSIFRRKTCQSLRPSARKPAPGLKKTAPLPCGPHARARNAVGRTNASYPNPDTKVWMDNMASRGWTAPTWPAEYGGGGLSRKKTKFCRKSLPASKPAGTDELWPLDAWPSVVGICQRRAEEKIYR